MADAGATAAKGVEMWVKISVRSGSESTEKR